MATALPADLSKVDPADAWKPWLPNAEEPWNRKRIAHLYRRAAFGATPAEVDAALKLGHTKTLEQLLSQLRCTRGRSKPAPVYLCAFLPRLHAQRWPLHTASS